MKNLLIILALIFGLIAAEPLIVAGFQDIAENISVARIQGNHNPLQPFNLNHAPTPQERSTHEVVFYYGEDHAQCTATAVGPHSLLTAGHCIAEAKDLDGVTFVVDHVMTRFSVLGVLVDHRDHVIILTNGPAFINIALYETRTPKVGELTYLYGFGGGVYPAVKKTGTVIDEFDPSEVDAAAGMFYVNTQVIPGDSGSIIYGFDGKILGLLTYQIKGDHENEGLIESAGFQLGFTPEQISKALTFKDATKEGTKQLPTPSLAGKGVK